MVSLRIIDVYARKFYSLPNRQKIYFTLLKSNLSLFNVLSFCPWCYQVVLTYTMYNNNTARYNVRSYCLSCHFLEREIMLMCQLLTESRFNCYSSSVVLKSAVRQTVCFAFGVTHPEGCISGIWSLVVETSKE